MPLSTTANPNSVKPDGGPLPLAVTMGEPAGIGPEIILKAWDRRQEENLAPFVVLGAKDVLHQYAPDLPLVSVTSPRDCPAIFDKALPVLDLPCPSRITPGQPDKTSAPQVIDAIDRAVELVFAGEARAVVTAPIQKSVLYEAGFDCPGHTEYLARLCNAHTGKPHQAVMMLASTLTATDTLRVVPLTIHVPLKDVPALITAELLSQTLEILHMALHQDFALSSPRIAVAGLNPHAGEDGGLGQEEQDIILPTLNRLRRKGRILQGPLSADTLFHANARKNYDAVLCMYHDQALIPLKTLDFEGGVNITLGLPIIRTSPDHGTALNIAGQNQANPQSFINALKMAELMAANRTMR
tara:strand:- start:20504 stop:21568 length:1065 start_codon:yes stop_codon:yes gene_type:complete